MEKPGRYVGIERNVTRKDLSAASVTLALAFPDADHVDEMKPSVLGSGSIPALAWAA